MYWAVSGIIYMYRLQLCFPISYVYVAKVQLLLQSALAARLYPKFHLDFLISTVALFIYVNFVDNQMAMSSHLFLRSVAPFD